MEKEEKAKSGGGVEAERGRRRGGGGGGRARLTFALSSKGEATAPARLPDMRCLSRSSSTLFFASSSV